MKLKDLAGAEIGVKVLLSILNYFHDLDKKYCLRLFCLILVVTIDGTLLTKSGTMTGGTTGGMEARSKKWNDAEIES